MADSLGHHAEPMDRIALRRALVDHGDLLFKRGPIPLVIKSQKRQILREGYTGVQGVNALKSDSPSFRG